MAAGDHFQQGPTSVAGGGTLEIEAPAGAEISLRNVYIPDGTAAGGVEVALYDGTNKVEVYDAATTSVLGLDLKIGNRSTDGLNSLLLTNNSGGAVFLAADGVEV